MLHVPWLQLHKSETELLDCYCWYYSLECWILIGCVIVWEVSSFLFRCVWYWTFSKIKTMVNVDILYECLLSIHFYASIYILKGWSCDLGALDGLFQRYYDCYLSIWTLFPNFKNINLLFVAVLTVIVLLFFILYWSG